MAAGTFRAEIAELRRIAGWVRDACAEAGVADEAALDLELCLDEVVSNIIRHGCQGPGPHTVAIRLVPVSGGMRATVVDGGKPFNPLTVAPRDAPVVLDDLTIGGYGLVILRHLAHDLVYERREDTNVLEFSVASGA